jgi:hypothetical protein
LAHPVPLRMPRPRPRTAQARGEARSSVGQARGNWWRSAAGRPARCAPFHGLPCIWPSPADGTMVHAPFGSDTGLRNPSGSTSGHQAQRTAFRKTVSRYTSPSINRLSGPKIGVADSFEYGSARTGSNFAYTGASRKRKLLCRMTQQTVQSQAPRKFFDRARKIFKAHEFLTSGRIGQRRDEAPPCREPRHRRPLAPAS